MVYNRQHHLRGFSLTEMAIVLGVIGLISGAIFMISSKVTFSNQVSTANKELVAISQNVRAIYAEQGGIETGTGGAETKPLDQLNVFPFEMRQNPSIAAGVIFHPWSSATTGTVTVQAIQCNGGNIANTATTPTAPCFAVTMTNLPQVACGQLAMVSSKNAVGLQQVTINANAAITTLPIEAAVAASNCASGNANTVVWVYLIRDHT